MTAPQPDPQALAVIAAYQAQTVALRASIGKYIQTLWRSLGEWRTPQIAPFVKQAVPTVAGAQHTMTGLTVAYLAALRRLDVGAAGKAISVDPKMVSGARARNGVSPAEVYERPFHLVWRQLADLPRVEGSIDKAIDAGMKRAVSSALTDLQLTKVQTSQRVVAKDGTVTGFRRVLEGPQSCALCIVAATQRYHHKNLLPIHPGCDCSIEPLRDGSSSQTITATVRVDDELVPVTDLPDIHDRIEKRFGRSSSTARIIPGARDAQGKLVRYRDVLVTHEHGELGPVLGVKGQPFLGPGDDDVPEIPSSGGGGGGQPPTPPTPPTPPVPTGGGPDEPDDPFPAIPPPPDEVTNPDLSRLTDDERAAIAYYTNENSSPVNKVLRAGRDPMPRSVAESVLDIDSGLAKYSLPQTVRAIRGVHVLAFGIENPDDLPGIVGTDIVEKAYLSTTLNEMPTDEFLGKDYVILELAVPGNTHALMVADLSEIPSERELLVERGRVLRIVSAVYDQELRRWRVRALIDPPEA